MNNQLKVMTLYEALEWCRRHSVTLAFHRVSATSSYIEATRLNHRTGLTDYARAPLIEEAVTILADCERTQEAIDKGKP